MHPVFVELFIQTDDDELLAYEEDKRHRARRGDARRSRRVMRVTERARPGLPRRT